MKTDQTIQRKSSTHITDILKKKEVMQKFPKVELHRHLEGSFHIPTLHKLALSNKLDYPKTLSLFKQFVQFPKDSEPDFLKFLSKFKNNWYRSFQDIYDITYHSIKKFKTDGLFYIELRFSPEHFALFNNFDRLKVTKTIIKAANAAATETNLYIRYLLTFNRGKQDQFEMIYLYKQISALKIPEIVGVDLAGDEINYPPKRFTEFFQYIKKKKQHGITIHAGEVSPPSQIWEAINLLSASRIGHGTSSIKDKKLQQYLIERNIILEQCITSNFQTGSWTDEKNHPLKTLYANNIPVTINSDDPSIQDTDLSDDYIKTLEFFSFTLEDLVALNETAIDGTFLTELEKTDLKSRYRQQVKRFTNLILKKYPI